MPGPTACGVRIAGVNLVAFMTFRLGCSFCEWKTPITAETDASYARNFQASHYRDHAAEMAGELVSCQMCGWTYWMDASEVSYGENLYSAHLVGHLDEELDQ